MTPRASSASETFYDHGSLLISFFSTIPKATDDWESLCVAQNLPLEWKTILDVV